MQAYLSLFFCCYSSVLRSIACVQNLAFIETLKVKYPESGMQKTFFYVNTSNLPFTVEGTKRKSKDFEL